MRRPLRTFSAEFRAKVATAALTGDRTFVERTELFELDPDQITQFRQHALEVVPKFFEADKAPKSPEVSGDMLVGRPTKTAEAPLEHDFLEGALSKAGLMSAKRWSTAEARRSSYTIVTQYKSLAPKLLPVLATFGSQARSDKAYR